MRTRETYRTNLCVRSSWPRGFEKELRGSHRKQRNLRTSYGFHMVCQGLEPVPCVQYGELALRINDLEIVHWTDNGDSVRTRAGRMIHWIPTDGSPEKIDLQHRLLVFILFGSLSLSQVLHCGGPGHKDAMAVCRNRDGW